MRLGRRGEIGVKRGGEGGEGLRVVRWTLWLA
jgi:hypothetical protein